MLHCSSWSYQLAITIEESCQLDQETLHSSQIYDNSRRIPSWSSLIVLNPCCMPISVTFVNTPPTMCFNASPTVSVHFLICVYFDSAIKLPHQVTAACLIFRDAGF